MFSIITFPLLCICEESVMSLQNVRFNSFNLESLLRLHVFAQTNKSTITPQSTIRWLFNISLWFKVGKINYCLFFSLSLSLYLSLSCLAIGFLYVCIPVPARTRTDRRLIAFYLLFSCRGLNLFVL